MASSRHFGRSRAAEDGRSQKLLKRSVKTCFFLKLQQPLRFPYTAFVLPLGHDRKLSGAVRRQFGATRAPLAALFDAERGLAASFARSIPPRSSDLTVVEGPSFAGDALGLLGWSRSRCSRGCLPVFLWLALVCTFLLTLLCLLTPFVTLMGS